jgi:WD40 repeat protein
MIVAAIAEPFPGLRPFTTEESELFFGRDEQVDELVSRLSGRRFLAVVGTSGSGKSSLVRAGLIPILQHGHLGPPGSEWVIAVVSRPGIDPLRSLGRALVEAFRLEMSELHGVEVALNKSSLGLTALSRQHLSEHQRLFIVVDQFEELFRYRKQSGDEGRVKSTAFVKLLLAATGQSELVSLDGEPLVYIVLTMRSDYLGKCAQFRGLSEALNDSQYLVPRMSRDQLREAIAGPVAWAGAKISDILVNCLLNDVGDDPDLLPMLQHALFRIWEESAESRLKGEPLNVAHYEAKSVGGIKHALDLDAETAFAKFQKDAAKQKIARRMFQRLVEPGAEDEESRRPTRLSEIVRISRAPEPDVQDVLDVFRKRGFVKLSGEDDPLLDISHESLVRQWRRLQRWTNEEAQSASVYRRLADSAWHKRSLYRGPDLAEALAWEKNEAPNSDWASRYTEDSTAFSKAIQFLRRSKRKRTAAWAGLALVVVAVFAVAVTFYILYRNAESQKRYAALETQLATSRQLEAQAQVGLDLRAPHNLLLALESVWITQRTGAFSPTASRQLLNMVLNATGGLPLQLDHPVAAVGVSPDDRWLATASAGNVQLWDMQTASTRPITLRGHDKVNALAFSPDGRTLATVGDDATLRLWDTVAADRAASMRVLTGHHAAIVDVAFSRNGRWLATGSKDGTARLWDFAGAEPATAVAILRNGKDVNTLAFSPDNHWLATGSSDGTVRLWDLLGANQSHGPIQRDINIGMDIRKVAFSPDSRWMVAGDTESYKVVLMRVTAPDKRFVLRVWQWVSAVAFSPDSRWLATPSQYDARLWDLKRTDPSSEPLILGDHKNYIADLAFSPDGNWFATGSGDNTVQLWNAANGFTGAAVLRGHEGPITALVFSRDSRHLITASADRTARLWNISSPHAEPLALIPGTAAGSTELRLWDIRAVDSPAASRVLGRGLDSGAGSVFSPDGQWIATIPAGGVDFVHLWNLSTPSPTHYLVRHEGGIWASPIFSPDGRWLATGGVNDPTIRLWDLKKPDPTSSPQVLRGHSGPVRSLAFSADGHRLVSGANDGLALVWDLTAADPSASRKRFAGRDIIKAVAISADGRYLATGSWEPDYAARIWDLSSPVLPSLISTLTFEGRVFDIAFSPDGRWFAAGSWDSTTQLLNLKKQDTKPFVLRGTAPTARTLSVAFSSDSQWLATGDDGQTARLWNLTVADPSADSTVLQATYKVGNVSFSPDGRWLALTPTEYRSSPFSPDGHWFASSGTNALLYHLRLEDLIRVACRTAGRNLTKSEWEKSFGNQPYRKTCPQLP